MFDHDVSYFMAFSAGLLSFLSPCILPLLPAYMSYITGLSIEDYSKELEAPAKRKIIINTLMFIAGFSIVFVALGASATFLGQTLKDNMQVIRKVGGIIIVVFGLHFLGLFRIKWLYREKRAHFKRLPGGYLGSLLIGVSFSAGWTPCIGPMLSAILIYASTADTVWKGIGLLSVYSLGLAVPFFLTSLAINFSFSILSRVKHHFRAVEIVTSILLIFVGVMIFTGKFSVLTGLFMRYWPFGD